MKQVKMILLGQFNLSKDSQGKFSLPSNMGTVLHNHAFLTQGFDRNLLLMSSASFERMYSLIKNTSISDPLARLLVRLFLGNAVELNIDGSGEFQIPSNLLEFAGVSEKIILVGQGDYVEIWSPSSWDKQITSLRDYQANIDRFAKFNLATI